MKFTEMIDYKDQNRMEDQYRHMINNDHISDVTIEGQFRTKRNFTFSFCKNPIENDIYVIIN